MNVRLLRHGKGIGLVPPKNPYHRVEGGYDTKTKNARQKTKAYLGSKLPPETILESILRKKGIKASAKELLDKFREVKR